MPYRTEWVEPEVFLEHAGVTVYHTYKNDEIENGPRTYYFTLDPEGGENTAFDVRDRAPGPNHYTRHLSRIQVGHSKPTPHVNWRPLGKHIATTAWKKNTSARPSSPPSTTEN